MLIAASLWLACLIVFCVLAVTAPTLEYMNDSAEVQR